MSKSNRVVNHVTIGEIARGTGLPTSTVRYYLKEELLQVVGHTPGGFFLFDRDAALIRIERIRTLKGQRLTLAEIREQLQRDQSE